MKTNAIRILEKKKIHFRTIEYEYNPDEINAVSISREINKPPKEVFKTLVTKANDNEVLFFVIPRNFELNLKKTATVVGKKKVELISDKETEPLTGHIRGGTSPSEMKKKFRTYIDDTALLFDEISISEGRQGIQILIHHSDIKKFIRINALKFLLIYKIYFTLHKIHLIEKLIS